MRPPGRQDRLGHLERRVGPAQGRPGTLDLARPQRRAVHRGLAGLGGGTLADHGAAGDQRRSAGLGPGGRDGALDRVRIVPVDAGGVPAIGLEPQDLVVGDGERGRAVDRDAVVVEQHDQPAQPEMAGQRGRLVADALHQAAVAGDDVGMVVDQLGTEARGQMPLRQRHPDRIGQALAQGPGGGLDPEGVPEFRVAGSARAELPEAPDLVQRHVRVAGQVEQRIEQHRAVAGRQHEAVAVGPVGMLGVVLEEPGPQDRGHVRHAHGHARMAGFRLLDRVHGERADGVGEMGWARGHGMASRRTVQEADGGTEVGANWTSSRKLQLPFASLAGRRR